MTPPDDPSRPRPTDAAPLDAAPLDDVPLDEVLRAAARHYHAPPPVPADAMWAAIQARRTAALPGALPLGNAPLGMIPLDHGSLGMSTPVLPSERPDVPAFRVVTARGGLRRPAWRRTSLAAAAVLLLGVGIGIGRRTAPDLRRTPMVAAVPRTGPVPVVDGPADLIGDTTRAFRGEPTGAAPPGARRRPTTAPAVVAAVPRPPASRTPPGAFGTPTPPRTRPDEPSAPLQAVAEQHLARAEALLTTFAGEEARGGPTATSVASDSAWARDLLTTTRLLLDSPAGHDPSRRALLEDLELVLAQIARLPRADTPEERALIDRAIRRGDLLAKLRGATSAPAPATARRT